MILKKGSFNHKKQKAKKKPTPSIASILGELYNVLNKIKKS